MPKNRRPQLPLPHDLDAFSSGLRAESDRSAALLAAALLDAQLENLFRARMMCHRDRLLGFDGPLSSFSSRIKLARALGWIDEEVEVDLDIIRNVRNSFAHSFDQDLKFEMAEIRVGCSKLLTIRTFLTGFDKAKDRLHRNFSLEIIAACRAVLDPPRMRYLVAAHWLAQHLKEMTDGTATTESLASQLNSLGENFTVTRRAQLTTQSKGEDVVPMRRL